jgi:uncharacterized protein YjbJ (UPF0337 family)
MSDTRRTTPRRRSPAERRMAARNTALRGRVKKAWGKLTGNPRLQAEGRRDQASGSLRQAGQKIKDAFRK